jgi:uracil-DNA glycosylase
MEQYRTGNGDDQAQALGRLELSTRSCRLCRLCDGRTQVVFGVGNPRAELMFVGEAPGFHEDRQGEPFVGQAGKLLTELLRSIGLTREDVYIANVVKCRPPDNRDPTPDEIEACTPHLMAQIAVIRPHVICTLGRFATKLLARTEHSMTAIHGKAKELTLGERTTFIFPCFHPAAALYAPANREVLEQDFVKLRFLLQHGLKTAKTELAQERPAVVRGAEDARRPPSGEQLPLW